MLGAPWLCCPVSAGGGHSFAQRGACSDCVPPTCRKPLPRAALHSFRAVRAMLSKQDGSQASLSHCEKASSCLRESLELSSPPKGTIDKVSWAGGG